MNFDDCKITNDVIQAEGFQNKTKFPVNGYSEDSARESLDNLVQHGVAPKYNALINKLNDAPIGKATYGEWTPFSTEMTEVYTEVEFLRGKTIQIRYCQSIRTLYYYMPTLDIPQIWNPSLNLIVNVFTSFSTMHKLVFGEDVNNKITVAGSYEYSNSIYPVEESLLRFEYRIIE